MNNTYHHPLFYQLPPSLRVLFSMILLIMGMGYVFALIQIYEVHAGRDGNAQLTVEDIRIAYRGSDNDTRLEAALKGPMSSMASKEEILSIVAWVQNGATEQEYEATVKSVIEQRCSTCHTPESNPHIPSFQSYSDISKVVQKDSGVSIGTLVRVSHIHLFGLTFIFAILGFIFSHAYIPWKYVKSVIIIIPFLAIILDVGAWWLTKVSTPFAYVVVGGGALMGISFAFQWTVSMYQMWFYKCPPDKECIVN